MSWWDRLMGRKPAPQIEFPLVVDVLPGELQVHVHSHEIAHRNGPIPCWTYITHGLWDQGQEEIVLTLRRRKKESPVEASGEAVAFFRLVHQLASQGSFVRAGGFSELGRDFLGRRGLLYFKPSNLDELPIPERALLAILVSAEELSVAKEFGSTRISTRLGNKSRYYPFPPWSDRDRKAVPLPELSGESLLCQTPRLLVAGVMALREGSKLILRVSESAASTLREQIKVLPRDQALAIPLEIDPQSNGCLVWEGPKQAQPSGITPEGSDGSSLSGVFILLVPLKEGEDEWRIIEDGFGVMLTEQSWSLLLEAIDSKSPLRLGALEEGFRFSLEWVPDTYRSLRVFEPETPREPDPSRTTWLQETVLLSSNAQLEASLEGPEALADYINDLDAAVEECFSAAPAHPGNDLLVRVELRPSERPNLSLASRPGIPKEVLESLTQRAGALRALTPLKGPIEFQLVFSAWGGAPKEP